MTAFKSGKTLKSQLSKVKDRLPTDMRYGIYWGNIQKIKTECE